MTSRPATQEQAWSAYSEGRDMQVKLKPAAHPIGTSVEVVDLFFNTPARRKFLRTEKTEFTHIDELIKRIALSCFDVTINLNHNGKAVRQYRGAKTEIQFEKRIAAVCGSAFVKNMLKIELEHQGLRLHGWITTPDGARQQNDLQYCYVNGRMMRDKLINHAIRQSYEHTLRPDQFATYILFINIDPHQVDVNVHPAKHEVRFHQARLVHDFIYQALSDALVQSEHITTPQITESAFHQSHCDHASEGEVSAQVYAAVDQTPNYPNKVSNHAIDEINDTRHANLWSSTESAAPKSLSKAGQPQFSVPTAPNKHELSAYSALLSTPKLTSDSKQERVTQAVALDSYSTIPDVIAAPVSIESLGKAVCVTAGRYVMMGSKQQCVLVSLVKAEWYRVRGQLDTQQGSLKTQPLLVPLSLKVDEIQRASCERIQSTLNQLGIQIKERNKHSLMVMGVPQPLRQQNLQKVISDLLSYAVSNDSGDNTIFESNHLADWLSDHITQVKSDYTLSEAIQIIAELEQLWRGQLPLDDPKFVQPIDFSATIAELLA